MRLKYIFFLFIFFSLFKVAFSMSNSNQYAAEKTIVKFSYIGVQDKPIASLVFSTNNNDISIDKLKSLKLFYFNDDYELQNVKVSAEELSNLIEAALSEREKAKNTDPAPVLAVVILNTQSEESSNFKLGPQQAKYLYDVTASIMDQNKKALEILRPWGHRTMFGPE
jgi:hypothetical protein